MPNRSRCVGVAAVLVAAALAYVSFAAPAPSATAAPPATTAPSTAPAPAAATRPAAPFSLSFDNAPVNSVLEQLSESAGFVVVKEGALEGRVTVFSRQPVTPDEAVTLLNAVLAKAGYTAVRNGRMLRVMA